MIKHCVLAAITAAVVIGVISDRSRAAGNRTGPPYEPVVEEFWGRWEGVKPSDAIIRAAPNAELQRNWDDLARRADDFQSRAGGRCLGHSEITQKSLGDNMQYVAFYAHYDPTPLRVQLMLYRSKDTWRVIHLRIDDEPTRWMDEAAQVETTTAVAVPAN